MKKFCKDYVECLKVSGKFMKEHWKGCIVVYLVTWFVTFLSLGGGAIIKDKIEDIKDKKEIEE